MDGAASQSRARGFRIVVTLFIVRVTAGICYGATLPRPAASGAELAGVFSHGPLAVAGGSATFAASVAGESLAVRLHWTAVAPS